MIRMRRVFASCALLILLAACVPQGRDTHELLTSALWMQKSAEFRLATVQSYRLAGEMLERGLADPTWTAAPEQAGTDFAAKPPAVILDLDETVIDNSRFEAQLALDRAEFTPAQWSRWVEARRADLLPGAAEFLTAAARHDVKVFFVTNRSTREKPATADNLAKLGIVVDPDGGNLMMSGERPGWGSDKGSRRAEIARRYRIVLLIGDQLGDFMSSADAPVDERIRRAEPFRGWWGSRWIILPNPLYGSWERALAGSGGDADKLRNKFKALQGFE
jgi:acid phosphatase